MDDLLARLKRERRWAVAVFIVAAALIGGAQLALAPDASHEPSATSAEAQP